MAPEGVAQAADDNNPMHRIRVGYNMGERHPITPPVLWGRLPDGAQCAIIMIAKVEEDVSCRCMPRKRPT